MLSRKANSKRAVPSVVGIVLAAAAALVFLAGRQLWNAKEQPDIILIVTDTLRADYLGCYGFRSDVSPALDRLAKESIVFENAIAPAPWTKPSVASLLTSLDPATHRVLDHQDNYDSYWKDVEDNLKTDALPDAAWTLAEALQQQGYLTAAWVTNPWINTPQWGFDQGFDYFYERAGNAGPILQEVQEWLDSPAAGQDAAAEQDARRPLFLYLHFMDVHGPYQSNAELIEDLSQSPSLGDDKILNENERKSTNYLGDLLPWKDSEQGEHLRNWRAAYASGVRLFDDRLAPFLDWLRGSGRLDRAVLVFTSDHGEALQEHGRWHHGYTLFEHDIRIPLIVRLPDRKGAGGRDERMTGLLDVMPTLLHLAGQEDIPEGLDGHVLLNSEGRRTAATADWVFSAGVADKPEMVSIRDRDYKLMWESPDRPKQLFDIRNDPGERVNLAGGARVEVERKMSQALADRASRLSEQGSLLKKEVELEPEAIKRLKSLGYIQ